MNIIKSKLFRRYLILGFFICTAGFIIAFYTNQLVIQAERQKYHRHYETNDIIEIIEAVQPEARMKTIQLMQKNRIIKRRNRNIILLDNRGALLTSTAPVAKDFHRMGIKPPHEFDHHPPPPPGHHPPGPMRPPREHDALRDHPFKTKRVQLKGNPTQELIVETYIGDPPDPRRTQILTRIVIIEIIGVGLGVLLTIFLIYRHFRKRTEEIETVLNNIRKGDLQSRMPIESNDEFGLAMQNFNVMADEIEQLVGKLRFAESTRRVLLGELAHDIRTPLASVRNFIEIVQTKEDKLTAQKKADIFDTCQTEIEYMTRLVDDLLFLGKIEEPSYRQNDVEIDLEDIIQTTAHNIKRQYPDIQFHFHAPQDLSLKLQMDEVLAVRLFRNVLDNAFSFARLNVHVEIEKIDQNLKITINDDGVGFHPSNLESFGMKKFSRENRSYAGSSGGSTKKISIGLGSVIMKKIVELYHGEFYAKNRESNDHKILGGQVNMILPSKNLSV